MGFISNWLNKKEKITENVAIMQLISYISTVMKKNVPNLLSDLERVYPNVVFNRNEETGRKFQALNFALAMLTLPHLHPQDQADRLKKKISEKTGDGLVNEFLDCWRKHMKKGDDPAKEVTELLLRKLGIYETQDVAMSWMLDYIEYGLTLWERVTKMNDILPDN